MANEARIWMVCLDDETAKDAGEMFKRVSSALSAVDTFMDKACELDEDAPDFMDQIGPPFSRLLLTVVGLYPNARQFATDIKSIGDFTVRTLPKKEK